LALTVKHTVEFSNNRRTPSGPGTLVPTPSGATRLTYQTGFRSPTRVSGSRPVCASRRRPLGKPPPAGSGRTKLPDPFGGVPAPARPPDRLGVSASSISSCPPARRADVVEHYTPRGGAPTRRRVIATTRHEVRRPRSVAGRRRCRCDGTSLARRARTRHPSRGLPAPSAPVPPAARWAGRTPQGRAARPTFGA